MAVRLRLQRGRVLVRTAVGQVLEPHADVQDLMNMDALRAGGAGRVHEPGTERRVYISTDGSAEGPLRATM